jgi:hypothetical protein
MSQSKRKKRKLYLQQENKDLSTVIVGICFIQEKLKAFSSKDSLKIYLSFNL